MKYMNQFTQKSLAIGFLIFVAGFIFVPKSEAAIAYRASATGTVNASTSLTINKPTGTVQNDVMVAAITINPNGASVPTFTPPSGWTMIQQSTNQSGTYYPSTAIFYKVAGASEGASYSWTINTTSYGGGWIASFSGVDTSNPIDVSNIQTVANTNGKTTSYSTPAVTTTAANDMVLVTYGGNTTSTQNTWSTPTSASVISSSIWFSGTVTSSSGFYYTQASAGSTGAVASTASVSSYGNAGIVALKPLGSVTTTTSSGTTYNSIDIGITVTTVNSSYFGGVFGTSNTGNCSTMPGTLNQYQVSAGAGTWTNYHYNLNSGVSANTSYYYCATMYDQVTATLYYGNILGPVSTQPLPAPTVSTYAAHTIDDASATLPGGIMGYGAGSLSSIFRWGTSNVACHSLPSTTPTDSTGSNYTGLYAPKTYRLTGLTANTTYYFCIVGTSTQGTTYGSVLSFTTPTGVGSGCDLLPASTLASAGDKTTLTTYLGSSKFQGTLLYKATTNGWTAANFHTPVDNQGATMVLIKNSVNNKIFGGFNPQSWNTSTGYRPGAGGFLFSLSDGYKLSQTVYADYQTYNSTNYGPTFGGGHDIAFNNSSLTNPGSEYTNASTYENPSSKGAFTYLDGGGGSPSAYNFTPSEIEVYKISVCTVSAPTVTTPTSASITVTSATLGGNVTSGGTQPITARGICYAPTATDSDPRLGDSGVTCTPEGATTTGVFTIAVNNLLGNTGYSYNAYATNSVGTGYTLGTFSTVNPSPTTVGTSTSGTPQSYYVTLNGSANPNGHQTYGHFRVFPTNPGSCSDIGGIRYPEGTVNFPDLDLGDGTSVVSEPTFSYAIPLNASTFLTPNTTYYYCAYAINTVNSTQYTTGASAVSSFTTRDGPANPCDPPSSGSLSIPSGAACNFVGTVGGVDAGTGTRNTAQLTIPSGTRLTIGAGQKIAFGSISLAKGALMTIARGGSLSGGGVYVHDNDRDNYLDDATQYVGSTASAATEFIRRNAISSIFNYSWKIASSGATYDCNKNSAYAYRVLPNLIRDADNDGYKTSTAAGPQCVGASATFNGRTYYNDGSGPN